MASIWFLKFDDNVLNLTTTTTNVFWINTLTVKLSNHVSCFQIGRHLTTLEQRRGISLSTSTINHGSSEMFDTTPQAAAVLKNIFTKSENVSLSLIFAAHLWKNFIAHTMFFHEIFYFMRFFSVCAFLQLILNSVSVLSYRAEFRGWPHGGKCCFFKCRCQERNLIQKKNYEQERAKKSLVSWELKYSNF